MILLTGSTHNNYYHKTNYQGKGNGQFKRLLYLHILQDPRNSSAVLAIGSGTACVEIFLHHPGPPPGSILYPTVLAIGCSPGSSAQQQTRPGLYTRQG